MQPVDCLEFQHQLALDNDVEAVDIQIVTAIRDRIVLLALALNGFRLQFIGDGSLIDHFEQTWPKLSVHFDAATDDAMNQRLQVLIKPRRNPEHNYFSFVSSCLRGPVCAANVSTCSEWPSVVTVTAPSRSVRNTSPPMAL